MADDLVLTPLEVARLLRVSDVTVRRMITRGYLPRIPGVRVVLIPRSAVERLLEGTYEGYNEGAGSSSDQTGIRCDEPRQLDPTAARCVHEV